jgi:hypothetical protein
VEPNGVLRHVPSEAVAVSLWGNNWAKRVVDVPDSFFVNYTIANAAVVENKYPAGSLVKYGTSPDVYYINKDGEAQKIASESAFLANRFKWDDVVTAPASATMPATGAEIAAKGDMADTSQGGNSGTGPVVDPNVGSGLSAALSSETAGSVSIPSGATLVSVMTVNFTAANDGDVTIEDLTFKRTGTGAVGEIDGGYLYVGDDRMTGSKTINTSDHTISFSSANIVVPAGETKAITLKIDVDSTASGNHAFQLVSASSVMTNGASVSGSFPITGNTMSFSDVDVSTVTFSGDTTDYSYKIGETAVTLTEFDIANGPEEDVKISRIRLKNSGTASEEAVSNISLEINGEVLVEGVEMVDDYVDFMLDTPFILEKSDTVTATVRGDILAEPTKTIVLYVRDDADLDVRGTAYGDFYSAKILRTAYDAGTETSTITIDGSDINISFDGPAASDVRDDRDNVVLAKLKVSVAGDGVQIDTFPIHVIMGGVADNADDNLTNVEMVDATNRVTYTADDQTNVAADHIYNFEDVTFASGKDYVFEIRGDIPDGASVGRTYQVTWDVTEVAGDVYATSDEAVVDDAYSSLSLTGKVMTVAEPTITITPVSTASATYVKDAQGVLLFKGKMTASGVDDLKVSKVKLTGEFGGGATNDTFSDAFSKLALYSVAADGTETLLDSETSLAATAVTFTGFTMNLPKGTSNGMYVVVRGDVKSSATAGTYKLKWNAAATADYTVKDSDNNIFAVGQYSVTSTVGHTSSISTLGTYSMVIDTTESGTNTDKNILAGGVRLLGRIKVTAQKEAAIIEDLVLQATTTSSVTSSDIPYLYLYSDKEMTDLLGQADFAAGDHPKALFEDVNVEIPTSGVTYLYVGGLVKGIDYSNSPTSDATAAAEHTIILGIPADATGYTTKVVGASTDETLSNTPTLTLSKSSKILGAVMTAVTSGFANGTLSNGTARDIFSFKVTAPSSSNIDFDGTALGLQIGETVFTLAGSAGVSLANFKLERVGGSDGEVVAIDTDADAGTATIDVAGSFAPASNDKIVRPGETAEFVLKADVSGVTSGDSLQVSIEGLSANLPYFHNTGTNGAEGGDTAIVYPLLSGVSYVRGGTLEN